MELQQVYNIQFSIPVNVKNLERYSVEVHSVFNVHKRLKTLQEPQKSYFLSVNALRHEQVQKLAEKFTLIPEHFLEVGGELLLCQEERGFLEVVRPILYD